MYTVMTMGRNQTRHCEQQFFQHVILHIFALIVSLVLPLFVYFLSPPSFSFVDADQTESPRIHLCF